MQVNLYTNASMLDATKDMIGAIDNSDFSVDHIIVVPDRFSLQMEKLVLSILPSKALFNVRVVGLSNLANEILKEKGKDVEVLTSAESLLITQKAIKNVKNELVVFNKTNINFCYEIRKIIAQLKSSMVDYNDLNEQAIGLSGSKFHDLKLIYKEYEDIRQKHDANSRLQLAGQMAEESELLKNAKIYFAQFDAFTKEAYVFLQSIIKNAKEVNISLAQSRSIGNEYIYERDVLNKLIEIAKSQGCSFQTIHKEKSANFPKTKEAILTGVYSYEKVKADNEGFFELFSASSITEEVNDIAKIIYNYTTKGVKYGDIVLMCGDLTKYSDKIENVFTKFEIPYYIDSSITADKTILANFIFSIFDVLVSKYSSESLINLFSNILLEKNEKIIQKIKKYSVDDMHRYKKFIANENEFDYLFNNIKNCKTSKEFSNQIESIVEKFKPKHEELLIKMEESGLIKEKNLNLQIYEILKEALSLISEYEDEIEIDEYVKKLKLILSFKTISTVPSFVDGVLVGDATTSPTLENKILIIMGGNLLPATNSDNGFLSDDDLLANFAEKTIEPTIKMINRRNRFKLFNLLTNAGEKLIISFQTLNDEGKRNEIPSYITSLCEIFDVEAIRFSDLFDRNSNFDYIRLGNRRNFINENYFLIDEKRRKELGIEEELFLPQKNQVEKNSEDYIFNEGRARVTQIEQYFSCPFKHFVTYGLKPQEDKVGEFEVSDIGNVCHRFCEIFVKKIIKNNYEINIEINKFIENNFQNVLIDEKLNEKFELLVDKKVFEKYLKKQVEIILKDIVKEMSQSRFRPTFIEEKFSNIVVGNKKKIHLIGKADRIDECENYFRIIDYKTGATGVIKDQLYYGDKVQLFLYQKSAREKLNKLPGGVFYFNAKFEYAKQEEDKKLLKGLIANDEDVISMIDKNFNEKGKSDLISLSKTKNGKYKGPIAKKSMDFYEDYAYKITNKAIDEIYEGFIEPKPDQNSCKYCKYGAICGYEKILGQRKKEKIGDFDGKE